MADPFGRALRDHSLGQRSDPLLQRDGTDVVEHPIESLYFERFDPDDPQAEWLLDHCSSPLLDAGAGVGRHALALQDRYEVVALEVGERLVETMADRGVEQPVLGDLFELPVEFPADRFETILAIGTQATLAPSRASLLELLDDLAEVTTADGTVVLDSYDPTVSQTADLLGYRADAARGVAFRVFHFEYDGVVGPTLLFRLISPQVLAEIAGAAGWELTSLDRPGDEPYYRAALQKA